ncbi:MAG: hypothetical protein ACM3PY_06105 [Omnitrophica WOR_2 bacterium]
MKILDLAPAPQQEDFISKFSSQLQQILSPDTEKQAQDTLIRYMSRTLGGTFTLLRNFKLQGLDLTIPLVLIGPPGIYLIYATAIKGIFEAKNDVLSFMDKSEKFEPARPNLIARTTLLANALETQLEEMGYGLVEVQPVLIFSSPGAHVNSIRPAVRVVQIDGMEHFTSGMLQGEAVLEREEAQKLVNSLTMPKPEIQVNEDDLRALAELAEKPAPAKPEKPANPLLAKQLQMLSKKVPLTSAQLIFLGVMAFMETIILMGLIFIVLTTS